jgi:serine/threonine protein kinase
VALAMQFAPGGSLADLLAQRGRLAPGQVVAVAAPIAEALASAHRRGVVHGDVKPANVLFTSDGEPLLSDFGVARTLGQVTSDQVSGTAGYLAPELLDSARPDPRTDVYSLAVVCYQALTGAPPTSARLRWR